MVTSVHLADVGTGAALRLLRRAPQPRAGLRWAQLARPAPIGRRVPPVRPGHVALVAAWDDDAALDGFLADDPLGHALRDTGYSVRLAPVRCVGKWPELGVLELESPDDGTPAAVLTLGRVRPRRALAFLRASHPAERGATDAAAATLVTGIARPPFVCTFSVWTDIEAMRAYVEHGAHRAAVEAHARRPFHSASAFVRFRPYDQRGDWPHR